MKHEPELPVAQSLHEPPALGVGLGGVGGGVGGEGVGVDGTGVGFGKLQGVVPGGQLPEDEG